MTFAPEFHYFSSITDKITQGSINGKSMTLLNFMAKIVFHHKTDRQGDGKGILPVLKKRVINSARLPTFKRNSAGIPTYQEKVVSKLEFLNSYSGKHCTYAGTFPFYVGPIPGECLVPNVCFKEFVMNNRHEFTDVEWKALSEDRVMVSGGWLTASNILKEFGSAPKHQRSVDYYLNMLEEEGFPWLELPKMDSIELSDLDHVIINNDSHPGYFTKMFFGSPRKRSAKYSLEVAKEAYTKLQQEIFKYTGIWEFGGRAKSIKMKGKPNENLSTRLVWMPEEWLTILACAVVQPFNHKLKFIKDNCLFLGKDFGRYTTDTLKRLRREFPIVLRTDWTHFDAYHTEEIILAAGAILARCYPSDRKTQRLLAFLLDTLIDKTVVTPPGILFRVTKGMPTGHPLMAVLNSIVNYISVIEIGREIYGKGKVKGNMYAFISGDDAQIYFKPNKNLWKLDNIVDKVSNYISGDSLVDGLRSVKTHNEMRSLFLKRYVSDVGVVGWSASKLLCKFMVPEKPVGDYFKQIDWFCDRLKSAPGDGRLLSIGLSYLRSESLNVNQTQVKLLEKELYSSFSQGIHKQFRVLPDCYDGLGSDTPIHEDTFLWENRTPISDLPYEIKHSRAIHDLIFIMKEVSAQGLWSDSREKDYLAELQGRVMKGEITYLPFAPNIRSKEALCYDKLVLMLRDVFSYQEMGVPLSYKTVTGSMLEWMNSVSNLIFENARCPPNKVYDLLKNYFKRFHIRRDQQ